MDALVPKTSLQSTPFQSSAPYTNQRVAKKGATSASIRTRSIAKRMVRSEILYRGITILANTTGSHRTELLPGLLKTNQNSDLR